MGKPRMIHVLLAVAIMLLALDGMSFTAYGGTITQDGNSNFTTPPLLSGSGISFGNNTVFEVYIFGSNAIVDMGFNIAPSGGTNTYAYTGQMNNFTGIPWTDFHFQLGSGLGNNFVPFTGATNGGIDFLTNPNPTSDVFMNLNQQTDTLSWSGGVVPDGKLVRFTFSFPVPDEFDTDGNFVLRSFPTVAAVPEPATMILIGSGLLGLLGLRRKFEK